MFKYDISRFKSTNYVADWVELYITYMEDSLLKAELSSRLESSQGSEPDEDFIDSVWNELETRVARYGIDKSPYKVEGKLVSSIIKWQDIPEYLTCLIFALEGNPNTEIPAATSGKLFEYISQIAVKNYINGDCVIYGSPDGEKADEMAKKMNEYFIKFPPSQRKDRDLDLCAWKSFGDNRASQIILLIQCAAGQNWKGKLNSLSIKAWSRYIDFAVCPLRGFTLPIIMEDQDLIEYSSDGGVIFDRTRLYNNIVGFHIDEELRKELITWCNIRLSEILG